eukprot:SM000195S05256  [mRNA]  locus=s195:68190:76507:- [translate_table: standard]
MDLALAGAGGEEGADSPQEPLAGGDGRSGLYTAVPMQYANAPADPVGVDVGPLGIAAGAEAAATAAAEAEAGFEPPFPVPDAIRGSMVRGLLPPRQNPKPRLLPLCSPCPGRRCERRQQNARPWQHRGTAWSSSAGRELACRSGGTGGECLAGRFGVLLMRPDLCRLLAVLLPRSLRPHAGRLACRAADASHCCRWQRRHSFSERRSHSRLALATPHLRPPGRKLHQIVAHTARFVRANGAQSEIVLRVKQAGDAAFAFLMPGHARHAYFRFLVDRPDCVAALLGTPAASAKKAVGGWQSLPAADPLVPNRPGKHGVSLISAAYGGSDIEDDEVAGDGEADRSTRDRIGDNTQSTGLGKAAIEAGYSNDADKRTGAAEALSAPVRRHIGKLAAFVARHGKAAEATVSRVAKERGVSLPFLLPWDEAHVHYRQAVEAASKAGGKLEGADSALSFRAEVTALVVELMEDTGHGIDNAGSGFPESTSGRGDAPVGLSLVEQEAPSKRPADATVLPGGARPKVSLIFGPTAGRRDGGERRSGEAALVAAGKPAPAVNAIQSLSQDAVIAAVRAATSGRPLVVHPTKEHDVAPPPEASKEAKPASGTGGTTIESSSETPEAGASVVARILRAAQEKMPQAGSAGSGADREPAAVDAVAVAEAVAQAVHGEADSSEACLSAAEKKRLERLRKARMLAAVIHEAGSGLGSGGGSGRGSGNGGATNGAFRSERSSSGLAPEPAQREASPLAADSVPLPALPVPAAGETDAHVQPAAGVPVASSAEQDAQHEAKARPLRVEGDASVREDAKLARLQSDTLRPPAEEREEKVEATVEKLGQRHRSRHRKARKQGRSGQSGGSSEESLEGLSRRRRRPMWEDSDGDEKDTRRRRREHRQQQRCHKPAESANSAESEGGCKRSRRTNHGGGRGESDSSCSEAGNATRRVAQKVSVESSLRAERSRGEPSNTVTGLEAVQSTERGERQGQDHGRSEAVAPCAGDSGAAPEPLTGAGKRPAIDVPDSVRAKVRAMLAGRLTPEQGPDAALKVGHLTWERKTWEWTMLEDIDVALGMMWAIPLVR